jgi:hypothetical protein
VNKTNTTKYMKRVILGEKLNKREHGELKLRTYKGR